MLLGSAGRLNPLAAPPRFVAVAGLPLAEQARILSQPEQRDRLVAEAASRWSRACRWTGSSSSGNPPDYEPRPSTAVAARAQAVGVEPRTNCYVDLLLGDEGRALLYLPLLNYFDGNLDAAGEMLAHPLTVPGSRRRRRARRHHLRRQLPDFACSPTGAATASGVPRSSCRSSSNARARATAEAVGLLDRGLLAPGYKADVNVIDFDHLTLQPPEMVHDLPAGGKRLLQRASGYLHTIVSGVETYADGVPTGALPGRLVRGQQPGPGTGDVEP